MDYYNITNSNIKRFEYSKSCRVMGLNGDIIEAISRKWILHRLAANYYV